MFFSMSWVKISKSNRHYYSAYVYAFFNILLVNEEIFLEEIKRPVRKFLWKRKQ